jgi:ribonuclease HII
MKVICGIDEAGRGPVIGPLVMAIVSCEKTDIELLKKAGVTDSKLLSIKKRTELAKLIKKNCNYIIKQANPEKIDTNVFSDSSSLNKLEAEITGKLISKMINKIGKKSIKKVIIDLPTKNKKQYLSTVKTFCYNCETIYLDAEFKADLNYIEVGAASILAKTTRDEEIKKIEKKLKIKIGSGYPSDPYTKEALNNHLELLEYASAIRKSWKTIANIKNEKKQQHLDEF